jgi:hypothetical protein
MAALARPPIHVGSAEVALAALELVLARPTPGPSKALFDAALAALAGEFAKAEHCQALLERMRGAGIAPDISSLNLVLSGMCARGDVAGAFALLREGLPAAGVRPNSFSVLMVLQACNFKKRGAYAQVRAAGVPDAAGRGGGCGKG